MKKRNIILAMVLCIGISSNVLSADYAGTFSEYRAQIRLLLGIAATNTKAYSDSQLNMFVRQSVITVNPVIKGKQLTYKIAMVYWKDSYTLDTSIIAISDVEAFKTKTEKQLRYVSRETFWQSPKESNAAKTGTDKMPDYYDWIEGTLFVWPPPAQNGDSLRITATKRIPSIAAVDSLSIIPQQYRPAIVQYATWLAARSRNHPMTESFKRDALEAIQMVNLMLNQRKAPSDSTVVPR